MTDGIKRDPEAKLREDAWRDKYGRSHAYRIDVDCTGERRLPWPTAADGDGVTEPPTMDEVWPGRRMTWVDGPGETLVLTGAPPEWYERGETWEVTVRLGEGYGSDTYPWTDLTPITPTTRLTVETTDPEALRRLLGNEHKIVEESADKALIAAAPDLLEVLETIENVDHNWLPEWLWDRIQAAIAKATGGTNKIVEVDDD